MYVKGKSVLIEIEPAQGALVPALISVAVITVDCGTMDGIYETFFVVRHFVVVCHFLVLRVMLRYYSLRGKF